MLLHWSVIWYLLPFLSKRKTTRCQSTWSTKPLKLDVSRLSRLEAENWKGGSRRLKKKSSLCKIELRHVQDPVVNFPLKLNDIPKHSNLKFWSTSIKSQVTMCRSAISAISMTIRSLGIHLIMCFEIPRLFWGKCNRSWQRSNGTRFVRCILVKGLMTGELQGFPTWFFKINVGYV